MDHYLEKIGITDLNDQREIINLLKDFDFLEGETEIELHNLNIVIKKTGKSVRIQKDKDGNIYIVMHIFVCSDMNPLNGLLQNLYIIFNAKTKTISVDETIKYDISSTIKETHIRNTTVTQIYPGKQEATGTSNYLSENYESFLRKNRLIVESLSAIYKDFDKQSGKEKIVNQL